MVCLGFEPAAILYFFTLYYCNCNEKKTEINKKWPGLGHFLKKVCKRNHGAMRPPMYLLYSSYFAATEVQFSPE